MNKQLFAALLVILFAGLVFSNNGTLMFKESESYERWRLSSIINGETPFSPNTPLPEGFVGSNENSSRRFHSNPYLTLAPELTINNFEAFTKKEGWYHPCVPLFLRYRYDSLLSWFAFGIDTEIGENFKAVINIDFKKDYRNYISNGKDNNTPPISNVPHELFVGNILAFDFSFPSFGYLNYSTENYSLLVGRNKISWGPMKNGLTISNASDYYDNFTGTYTSAMGKGNFTYTFNLISSASLLSDKEWEKQDKAWDLNQQDRIYNTPAKHIIGHKFDFQPLKWFRFGIGEVNAVGGKSLDLTDFSPVIIYHNTYGEGYSNVMLSADFSIVLLNGLNIYGEFTLDDYAGPTEPSKKGKPKAYAYGGGIEYAFDFLDTGLGSAALELYHTDTWIYNRWQPLLKITNRTITKSELPGGRDTNEYPLGFKYGPDLNAFAIFVDAMYEDFSIKARYEHFIQGEINLRTPYLYMENPDDDIDDENIYPEEDYPGLYDFSGPVGETTSANIITFTGSYSWNSLTIGIDTHFYFGDYFKKFFENDFFFEVRPFVEYTF
ncbi:MAG: capsule assembly Wzi family protein [Kosmotogaceae bacterium]